MKMEKKYVRRRRILAAAVFITLVGWGLDATTPKQCKVPVSEMNSFCKELLYP